MQSLLNKLVLGTAQLGLDYGINNKSGKPSKQKALKTLEFAYKNRIKVFDTGHDYGTAEEILGEFCQRHNLYKKIKIITKVRGNISEQLNQSLARLKMEYVEGCLLHEPKDLRNEKNIESLKKIKSLGLAKNIGVSVYEPKDAVCAVKSKGIDYIQVPYNIFDQRLNKTEFFELAKKNRKKVFARSAFLQGLLLMPQEKIPEHLKEVKAHLIKLDKIIAKYGFFRKQVALLFALENKNIDYVVLGVDSVEQLKENIDFACQNINFQDCFKELKENFSNVERSIISPNLWEK